MAYLYIYTYICMMNGLIDILYVHVIYFESNHPLYPLVSHTSNPFPFPGRFSFGLLCLHIFMCGP